MSGSKRYRKRPLEVDAIQWTGDNLNQLLHFTQGGFDLIDPEDRVDDPDCTAQLHVSANGVWLPIETGEWVIRDVRGWYPCKPDVFDRTYEEVQS